VLKATGAGVCVRSGQWTPALATPECDPDIAKPAPAPAKPAAAPAKPASAPAPAPAPQKAAAAPAKPAPAAKKPEPLNIEEKIELQGMAFNKADMTDDNKKELDQFFAMLSKPAKEPVARQEVALGAVIVTGHSDRIGAMKLNMKLSEQRAITVRDYITSKGIDQKLIFWEGKGPKQPIPVTKFCDNKMNRKQLIECLAPNRRVTVEVVGLAQPTPKPAAKPAP
jgi:OOP family OmpA-OmpF porin